MHIQRIHEMIEKVAECANGQFSRGVDCIDTQEMKAAAGIIKDLSEAEYYAKITKAMSDYEHKSYYETLYFHSPQRENGIDNREIMREWDMNNGQMFYGFAGDTRNTRDTREGKSGEARKWYMETKHLFPEDKQQKMKSLEEYVKDLGEDITEMISDMSQEEKNILKTKMQTLAQRI